MPAMGGLKLYFGRASRQLREGFEIFMRISRFGITKARVWLFQIPSQVLPNHRLASALGLEPLTNLGRAEALPKPFHKETITNQGMVVNSIYG